MGEFICRVITTILVLIVAISVSPVYGKITTSCSASVVSSFTPCLSYVTGSGGNGVFPSSQCCYNIKEIVGTSMDCACLLITGNVPFSSSPINRTLAKSLLLACNMSGVPFVCKGNTGIPLTAPSPFSFNSPSTETSTENKKKPPRTRRPPLTPPTTPSPPPPPAVPAFDHYKLVLSWPRAVCNVKENPCDASWPTELPGDRFTIHGLWPQPETSPPATKADFTKILVGNEKLKIDLLTYLPNAKFKYDHGSGRRETQKERQAIDFWTYEWNKHGALSGMSLVDYFQTTIDLYKRVGNLYSTLTDNGMSHGVDSKIDITKVA